MLYIMLINKTRFSHFNNNNTYLQFKEEYNINYYNYNKSTYI